MLHHVFDEHVFKLYSKILSCVCILSKVLCKLLLFSNKWGTEQCEWHSISVKKLWQHMVEVIPRMYIGPIEKARKILVTPLQPLINQG